MPVNIQIQEKFNRKFEKINIEIVLSVDENEKQKRKSIAEADQDHSGSSEPFVIAR